MGAGIPPGDLVPLAPLPPPPAPFSADNVVRSGAQLATLGRRAGAIAIDSTVWLAAAIPIVLTYPSLYPGNGFHLAIGLKVNGSGSFLTGVPLLVSMVVWLAYMALMEATVSASIGKLLTGIRVVGDAGGRPAALSVIGRTAMRIVDFLPAFYLFGGIVATSSKKRQRLGDRLAGTLVVRVATTVTGSIAPDSSNDVPVAAPGRAAIRTLSLGLAIIVLAVGAYVWLGRSAPGTFDRYGVSFHYPISWSPVSVLVQEAGSPPAFREHLGIDPYNYLAVSRYQLGETVTPANASRVLSQFSSIVRTLPSRTHGSLVKGPDVTMVAGLPAVTFSLSYTLANGFSERMDGIALFIQETEYELSCEYTPEHAGEIQAGCDQAIDTLRIK